MADSAGRGKSKTSLRKAPKQERSKDLVDAVMTAAARILETTGIHTLTTNKVASMAGVSIGSLYQYFPGKDAIFSRLIERQLESNAAHYRAFVDEHRGEPLPVFIETLMSDVVDLFVERRAFISSLFAETPKLKKTREVLMNRNKIVMVFADVLRERAGEMRDPTAIDEQIYVLSHAVLGLLQVSVLDDFTAHSADVIKKQLTALAKAYLLKP